jgi:hypothetical protein
MTPFDVEIALRAAAKTAMPPRHRGLTHIYLALMDHFEPQVGKPSREVARRRMEEWAERYPAIASRHRDSDGCVPKHSFFYPWDEFDSWEFERLAELCAAGSGEVELHLHHCDDTDESLRRKLREALETYRSYGTLSQWPDGRPAFGFIHGNWALDNSRKHGERNFCGVDNELTVLREEGCYADFTFPSWQHMSQPRQLNSIYYAVDDPVRPKSYDRGVPAKAGRDGGSNLLLIQGPLVPYMDRSRGRARVAMDDSDMAACRRYTPARLDRWVRAGIHVQGKPDHVFVKLHCHGAADGNLAALLGEDLDRLFSDAESRYNDGSRYQLHYVSAREMCNAVKCIEAGLDPANENWRSYLLKPPPGRLTAQHAEAELVPAIPQGNAL